jgi:hypothetical protein
MHLESLQEKYGFEEWKDELISCFYFPVLSADQTSFFAAKLSFYWSWKRMPPLCCSFCTKKDKC